MGSRRRRYAALVAALGAIALSSCASGPPPGFSGGDQWVIPLIGPLEDGPLLVPALVNDKGPFVFAIDPDAHVSIIDEDVLKAAKPATGEGPRMLDENDTEQNKFYAEIISWQIGSLTVQGPKPAQIVGKGTFDVDGRRVHGVIGRDIIADSLVFGFYRDSGIVVLQTQKEFKTPAGATPIKYSKLQSRIPNAETLPLPRRLVKATIGGQAYPLHVDFGVQPSQLRSRAWARAKLVGSPIELGLVDEAGMVRKVKETARAESVSVAGVAAKDVVFVPYGDKRWPDQDIEGTLGLGFFKPFNVVVNWDSDAIYVSPRDRSSLMNVSGRIGRWHSKTLTSCANAGCVKVSAIDPLAGKPPEQMPEKHPGLVTSIARDASAKQLNLEVLIAVTPAEGKGPLKWLVANLPAGTDRAMTHLSADYIGARFTVVDASLFPRPCPAEGACVDTLTPPYQLVPDDNAPQTVPTAQVKLKAGKLEILPELADRERPDPNERLDLAALVQVCATREGAVDTVKILKRSELVIYDEKIERTIREEWTFEPYVMNGKPIPFCAAFTFVYQR
jgi:hypothetical protein